MFKVNNKKPVRRHFFSEKVNVSREWVKTSDMDGCS